MDEMSRANAQEIEFYGGNLDECVNELFKLRRLGKSVYINFNRHKLYSCDVTVDSAYLEVCGMTKNEFEKEEEEWQKKYEEEKAREAKEAEAKTPEWIKRGEKLIYPEMAEEWEKCVKSRASGLYNGRDLEAAIEIMEKLDAGATLDEANELMESQHHSGASYGMARNIILTFSKKGPEFCEYVLGRDISEEEKQVIEDRKNENLKLEELHRDDSEKKVSAERKRNEKEITILASEKGRIMSEIRKIGQQIENLKNRAKEFVKNLGKTESKEGRTEER